jgi:exopolysaccharide biosynthesis polyprenyl glycosylphosphotransferase
MLRRFSTNFAIFSIGLDAIIVLLSMLSMSVVRVWLNPVSFIAEIPAGIQYPLWLYVTFPLVWVFILAAFSIYDSKKFFRVVDELSTLTVASLIAAVSQAGILYLTYREFSRALFLLIVFFAYLLCVLWRLGARVIFRLRKETLHSGERLLIVGSGSELQKTQKILKQNLDPRLEQLAILDLKKGEIGAETPEHCPQTIQRVIGEIERIDASDVVVALPRNMSEWIEVIATAVDVLPLGVWVALDYYDLSFANAHVENLNGMPLLDLRAPALNDYARVVKRSFDLVMGMISLIVVLPLMLVVGLVVLIDAGWPIFFLQPRVGENGRLFKMIKFRTMVRDAESRQAEVQHLDENGNVIHKTRSDPRVTRSGHFLRRFSLDELPQLINVIKGEMSLVGPRPELPALASQYEHWQRRRLSVPPGITGWWQVNGRSDRVMHLHTEDDLYYIENYSIWLDLRILIRTIWVVIMGNGAY